MVLIFAFLMGILGAFGEPVLGSLQIAGAGIDPDKAPLLYYILVKNPLILSLTVSLGVCRATGKSDSGMAGFGMVGLISVLPITMIILLTYRLSLLYIIQT